MEMKNNCKNCKNSFTVDSELICSSDDSYSEMHSVSPCHKCNSFEPKTKEDQDATMR